MFRKEPSVIINVEFQEDKHFIWVFCPSSEYKIPLLGSEELPICLFAPTFSFCLVYRDILSSGARLPAV